MFLSLLVNAAVCMSAYVCLCVVFVCAVCAPACTCTEERKKKRNRLTEKHYWGVVR